jgi:hypothetical protein
LNSDGTLDSTFNAPEVIGDDSSATPVSALTLDPAGRLVFAGQFVSVGGVPQPGLARLNADGTLDATFNTGAVFGRAVFQSQLTTSSRSTVTSIQLQDDGGIIVGGGFGTVNNQPRLGLARFQADKGSSPGGNPNGGSGPKLSSPNRAVSGAFSMLVTGQAGVSYRVEASSDLRTWSNVGTVTGAAAPVSFTDPSGATSPQRFYRVVGS